MNMEVTECKHLYQTKQLRPAHIKHLELPSRETFYARIPSPFLLAKAGGMARFKSRDCISCYRSTWVYVHTICQGTTAVRC